jgi:hypothetical protein
VQGLARERSILDTFGHDTSAAGLVPAGPWVLKDKPEDDSGGMARPRAAKTAWRAPHRRPRAGRAHHARFMHQGTRQRMGRLPRFPGAMASGSETSHPGSFPRAAMLRPGRNHSCPPHHVKVPDRHRALRLPCRPGNRVGGGSQTKTIRFPGAMASASEPSHPGSFPRAAMLRPGRSRPYPTEASHALRRPAKPARPTLGRPCPAAPPAAWQSPRPHGDWSA